MQCRSCTGCKINWPYDYIYYTKCPKCGNITHENNSKDVLTDDQALVIVNRANFERYLKGDELRPAKAPNKDKLLEHEQGFEERLRRAAEFELIIKTAGFTVEELDEYHKLDLAIGKRFEQPEEEDESEDHDPKARHPTP